jgi:hypothetical protein
LVERVVQDHVGLRDALADLRIGAALADPIDHLAQNLEGDG